ncbi:MAG TPA: cytochrome c3 family protein [Nitrospirota bacterium]|nr:cytochrome c3 family protein [Nitrospirota bacterium]
MKNIIARFVIVCTYAVSLLFTAQLACPLSAAEKSPCLKCHQKLVKGKVIHKAVEMGCEACHGAINAGTVPHKKTNTLPRGLSSDQPDLCYGCHDQAMFTKKNVHPAIGMGCTTCHNPHSSMNKKLLTSVIPALCFTCHDKAGFTAKFVHPPVAGGECLTCHSPHSTDGIALLLKKPVAVCLDCHPDAVHGQHAPSRQPPVTEQASEDYKGPVLQDPARPGRPFYCGSCHNPHSGMSPMLFRFDVKTRKDLCIQCHKM